MSHTHVKMTFGLMFKSDKNGLKNSVLCCCKMRLFESYFRNVSVEKLEIVDDVQD